MQSAQPSYPSMHHHRAYPAPSFPEPHPNPPHTPLSYPSLTPSYHPSSSYPYPHSSSHSSSPPDPSVDTLMSHLSSTLDDAGTDSHSSYSDMLFLAGLQSSLPPSYDYPAATHPSPWPPRAAGAAAFPPPPPPPPAPLPPPAPTDPSHLHHPYHPSPPSSPPQPSPLLAPLSSFLPHHFGFSSLHRFQLRTLHSLLIDQRDVLLVNQRHTGRSTCYHLAALLSGKLAIVLCPASLPPAPSPPTSSSLPPHPHSPPSPPHLGWMAEQVQALQQRGIAAAALTHHTPSDTALLSSLLTRPTSLSLLFTSLFTADLHLDALASLTSLDAVTCLAVEEAQCATPLSVDYRAEYTRVRSMRDALVERSAVLRSKRVQEGGVGAGGGGGGRLPLLALASPCGSEEQVDVMRSFGFPVTHHLHIPAHADCGLLMQRPNVQLTVQPKRGTREDMQRLFAQPAGMPEQCVRVDGDIERVISGSMDAREGRVFHDLASVRGAGLTIIYSSSKKSCHELHGVLLSLSIKAAVIHAGLSDEQRQAAVRLAQFHQVEVVLTICSSVSTFSFASTSLNSHDSRPPMSSAFFIDKPGVRRVVFYGLPLSLESFIQLSADAGLDGGPAAVSLFWSPFDYQTTRTSLSSLTTGDASRRHLWKLDNVKAYAEARGCRKEVLRRYFAWHPNGASSSVLAGVEGSPVREWKPNDATPPLWPAVTEPFAPLDPSMRECGQCDNCLLRHPQLQPQSREAGVVTPTSFAPLDVGDAAYLLLSSIHQSSSTFHHPVDIPIAILRGEHTHPILCPSHQRLTVFGRGSLLSFRFWLCLSDVLTQRGYIEITRNSAPSVGALDGSDHCQVTPQGMTFLKSHPVSSTPASPHFSSLLTTLPSTSLWTPATPPTTRPDPAGLAYGSELYGRPLFIDCDAAVTRLQWLHLQSAQWMEVGGKPLGLSNLLPCELTSEDSARYLDLSRLTDHHAYTQHLPPHLLLPSHCLILLARFRPINRDGLLHFASACSLPLPTVDSWASRLVAHLAQQEQLLSLTVPIASDPPSDSAITPPIINRVGIGGPTVVSPVTFADVFAPDGVQQHILFSSSRPVRQLNHAQMMVWQAFEAGWTIRQISDSRNLKPAIILAYIIYCLESYSPSPSHPVFVHWPRFSIPPEVVEKVGAAMARAGGLFERLHLIKAQLDEELLDEDVRIAMIRWKMERAVGSRYTPYDVYKVVSAQEAKERVERLSREDAEAEKGGDTTQDDEGEGKAAPGERAHSSGDGRVEGVDEDQKMGQDGGDSERAGGVSGGGGSTQVDEAGKGEVSGKAASAGRGMEGGRMRGFNPLWECEPFFRAPEASAVSTLPMGPPPATPSEMLHHLSLHGGVSASALQEYFECDWSTLEPLLQKLIADQVVWKRGLLYCPS